MIELFWTVLFCLGWRIVTDEGQLLYFLRKPFENNDSRIEALELLQKKVPPYNVLMHYFGKPFVMCITCMASIWGVIVYTNVCTVFEWKYLILNCVAASFIQTFIWKLYVTKLD